MKLSLKLLIAAIGLSLFLPQVADSCLAGSHQNQTRAAQTADSISLIRQKYAGINKRVNRDRKVKKELSGFSLEGGEMIAYFDGPAIVKIVANHYGESGRAVEEYYYSNGKLIFVLRKDFTYNRPLSGKVVKTTVNRLYFQDDRLIRWINEDGKQVPATADEFKEKQDEYLEASRKFADGARSKNATIDA